MMMMTMMTMMMMMISSITRNRDQFKGLLVTHAFVLAKRLVSVLACKQEFVDYQSSKHKFREPPATRAFVHAKRLVNVLACKLVSVEVKNYSA